VSLPGYAAGSGAECRSLACGRVTRFSCPLTTTARRWRRSSARGSSAASTTGAEDLVIDGQGSEFRALYLTHFLGFPQHAERWRAWLDRRGLLLIEDEAQAWLATQNGRPAGSIGDPAVFASTSPSCCPRAPRCCTGGRPPRSGLTRDSDCWSSAAATAGGSSVARPWPHARRRGDAGQNPTPRCGNSISGTRLRAPRDTRRSSFDASLTSPRHVGVASITPCSSNRCTPSPRAVPRAARRRVPGHVPHRRPPQGARQRTPRKRPRLPQWTSGR
jgi:hypothetical protein